MQSLLRSRTQAQDASHTPSASGARSNDGSDAVGLYLDGVARLAPWLVGIVPYGLIIGTVISSNSVPVVSGWAGGPLIFGGSAHISVLELMDRGAPVLVVMLTTLIVHSRLLLYSAALAPRWNAMPRMFRAVAAAMITDPTYAVATEIYKEHEGTAAHRRYFGACAALAIAWVGAITLGILVGGTLPASLRLNYAIPLFLVGQLVKMADQRPERRAVLVGGAAALIAASAPLNLCLLIGIVAGVVAGDALKKKEDS